MEVAEAPGRVSVRARTAPLSGSTARLSSPKSELAEVSPKSAPPETATEAPAAPAVETAPRVLPERKTGIEIERERLQPTRVVPGRAVYRSVLPGILQVPADVIIALARKSSLWPMTFGLACCAIEMIATYMSHHDLDRFGIIPWPSPRQADVMIVAGTVTKKMAPAVRLLYDQMPNPKWVIAMGACATNGGPYTRYDRVLQGVDKIIPVDVYVPGCPPRPEALMDGFIALQNKIMEERRKIG